MPPVKMTVVDDRHGAPLEGVVAMFWEMAHRGTFTGHGGTRTVLFAAEARSDEAGRLDFAAQEFGSQPFFLNTNYDGPAMLLLKPGYAPAVLFNRSHNRPTLEDATVWDRAGDTVRLRRLDASQPNAFPLDVAIFTDQMLEPEGRCAWKRVPLTIVTADGMKTSRYRSTTLARLLNDEPRYLQQGCGSPQAFFAPYVERAAPAQTP